MVVPHVCMALSLICVQNHVGKKKAHTVKYMVMRILVPNVNFVKNRKSISHDSRGADPSIDQLTVSNNT